MTVEKGGHPHLRQLWDLDQPLEILQVTGAIEQTLQPETGTRSLTVINTEKQGNCQLRPVYHTF